MDVLTSETYWALNKEIIKQVTSSGLSLLNYQDDARSNKHKIQYYLSLYSNTIFANNDPYFNCT